MKKIILYIISIIVVITLGIVIGLNSNKSQEVSSTNENLNNQGSIIKKDNNNIINDNISTENKIINETQSNEVIEEKIEPKTDLEKATEIAKKDWGEDNSIYFAQDGKTFKGEYVICVRNKNSTKALAWYIVDVENGTFVKEE